MKDSKIIGIYMIKSRCKPFRIYIGSSKNIASRWNGHLRDLYKNKHTNKKLQNHYNKYGVEDFDFSIIEECSLGKLRNREQFYINKFSPFFNIYFSVSGNRFDEENCVSASERLQIILDKYEFPKYDLDVAVLRKKSKLSDAEIFLNKINEIKGDLTDTELALLDREYKLRYSTHRKYSQF